MPKKKYIVSVGAGLAQEPFINELYSLGYGVISFGYGKNSKSAIEKCDYFKELDTHDYVEVINWLKSLPVNIHGAGSFAGGGAILTLQKILSAFDLPTRLNESLQIGTDKGEQQQFYHQNGLSSIQTWTKRNFNLNETNDTDFIIKPAIGRGSERVKRVKRGEITDIINTELTDEDVIQSFVNGPEFRVLVVVQGYEVKLLAPLKRVSFRGTFLLGRLFYPNVNLREIKKYYQDLIKKLDIKDAIIKSDIILSNNSINMIEMDIGVGGGVYYKNYISKLMGYDLLSNYIRLITNEPVDSEYTLNNNLKMDYVFNINGTPVDYNDEELSSLLIGKVGKHTIVKNFLEPQKHGKCSSNAHFIFTVIHQNNQVSNDEINHYVNEKIFRRR